MPSVLLSSTDVRAVRLPHVLIRRTRLRQLLRLIKPLNDRVARIFKEIVVRGWNERFEQAINSGKKLQIKISRCEEYELKINRKYIESKITESERNLQKKANEKEL